MVANETHQHRIMIMENKLTRKCTAWDLILSGDGVQCGNCGWCGDVTK